VYDIAIQKKISMLPENVKKEVLDFIEFLLIKYSQPAKRQFRSLDLISINTKGLEMEREDFHARQSNIT